MNEETYFTIKNMEKEIKDLIKNAPTLDQLTPHESSFYTTLVELNMDLKKVIHEYERRKSC